MHGFPNSSSGASWSGMAGQSLNPNQHLPFVPQQQTYIGTTNVTSGGQVFQDVPWTHDQVRAQYDAAMRAAVPATDRDWLEAELQEVMAA